MYDLQLTTEQLEFRDTVRDFVNAEVKPVVLNSQRLDRNDRTLPLDVLRKASQLGLRTLALAEEHGGVGADNLTACIVTEELAAGDAGVAAVLSETSSLARMLFDAMTAAQRERFLPAFLADDDFHLAFADREPESDAALGLDYHRPREGDRLATTAVPDGDGWLLNGIKRPVANAPIAKLICVEAQTDDGVRMFLLPLGTSGMSVRSLDADTRWYHGACGEVTLKDCRVPTDSVIAARRGDNPAELALNIGIGRAAYEAAVEYAQLRVQGGRRIIEHQAIGTKLAEVAIRLEAARALVWQAAWAADNAVSDRSLSDLPHAAVARAYTAEAIYHATKDAAECFGAMGVMRDMPLQKYVHDALVCLHSGLDNSEAKLRIAEAIAGYRRAPALRAAE